MRSIYRHPIISIMLINLFTLSLIIYLYNYNSLVLITLPLIGTLNGKVLKNGVGINNKKRVFILISILVISVVFLFCIYNILINKYI